MDEGQRLVLRTDGASRGNPGHAAAGVVVEADDGTVLARGRHYLGILTNNQAEYQALILGLKAVARYNPAALRVYMDSELIVLQMTGRYRVKNAQLLPLYTEARALAARLGQGAFTHVPRGGHALAHS